MVYNVSHRTTFRYSAPVSVGDHVAYLKPRSFSQNKLVKNAISIHPAPSTLTERVDYFGNIRSFFAIEEPHKELIVEAKSQVKIDREPLPPANFSSPWEMSARALADDHSEESLAAYQFQFASPRVRPSQEFAAYALKSFTPGRPMREALIELTARIYRDFRFDAKVTNVRTPPEEVFRKRHGVCQDFAQVEIACLRSINVAARYVSGYLRTYPPPGKPRMVGADASHAWISAYGLDEGWLDMDPTNNVAPTDGHVTLAWGRDYGDVSPLRGLISGGGQHSLKVEVDIEPLS